MIITPRSVPCPPPSRWNPSTSGCRSSSAASGSVSRIFRLQVAFLLNLREPSFEALPPRPEAVRVLLLRGAALLDAAQRALPAAGAAQGPAPRRGGHQAQAGRHAQGGAAAGVEMQGNRHVVRMRCAGAGSVTRDAAPTRAGPAARTASTAPTPRPGADPTSSGWR